MGTAPSTGQMGEHRRSLEATFLHEGLACCRLCGALISSKEMEEHLQGDELMLRIIHHNNPDWTPKECLDYYIATYRPGTSMHLNVEDTEGSHREGTTA